MNSYQRRKQRRRIDQIYKQLFGCTGKEFFAGGVATNGLYNGSHGGCKTWRTKTAAQILDEVNEQMKIIDFAKIRYDLASNSGIPYRLLFTDRPINIVSTEGI